MISFIVWLGVLVSKDKAPDVGPVCILVFANGVLKFAVAIAQDLLSSFGNGYGHARPAV